MESQRSLHNLVRVLLCRYKYLILSVDSARNMFREAVSYRGYIKIYMVVSHLCTTPGPLLLFVFYSGPAKVDWRNSEMDWKWCSSCLEAIDVSTWCRKLWQVQSPLSLAF